MTSSSHRRAWRALVLLLAGAVVAVAVLSPSSSAQAMPPRMAVASSSTVSAFSSFAGCVAAQGAGDLLVLMDESGTIGQTDPSGARITAMRYLLDSLAARAEDDRWRLSVAMAGFAENYAPLAGWSPLTPQSVSGLKQRLGAFADRNDGIDTDYWTALDGAQRALRERARARRAAARPCQAVVVLTDGELDVDPRRTSSDRAKYGLRKPYAPDVKLTDESQAVKVKQLAQTSLCRNGGLADQLRANNIRTFAIGLSSPSQKPSFQLIQSIATGVAGQVRCGARQAADSGYFTPASDLDDLLFAIGNLDHNDIGSPQGKVCPTKKSCPRGTRTFVLDDSVQRVQILAGASVPGIEVRLTAPDRRTTLPLEFGGPTAGRGALAGMPVSWQWATPKTVMASFSRRDGAPWAGRWSITFIDPTGKHPDAVSRTVLQITGDIEPALLDADRVVFRSGQVTKGVRFGLVHGADRRAANVLGAASLIVQTQPSDGSAPAVLAQLDKAALSRPVDLDLSALPVGKADLVLRLQLTTQPPPGPDGKPDGAGTRLQETSVPVQVDIRPPLGQYPTPGAHVDFGNAKGTTRLTGSLDIAGPGCAWLESASVNTKPDGVQTVQVTAPTNSSQSTCLRVPAGQRAALPMQLAFDATGSGTATGRLQLRLLPASGETESVAAVASFTASAQRPARTTERLLIAILMFALGLGLPAAAAWLGAWYSARLPSVPLRWAMFDVTVVDGTVLRAGRPPVVTEDELQWLTFGGRRPRRVQIPGGPLLRAMVLPSVRSGARVLVDAGPDRNTVARTVRPPRRFRHSNWQGLLPLAVHQHWAAVADGPDRARLLVLFAPTADDDQRVRVLAAVAEELPRALAGVRAWPGSGRSTTAASDPGEDSASGGRQVRTPGSTPSSRTSNTQDSDDWFG